MLGSVTRVDMPEHVKFGFDSDDRRTQLLVACRTRIIGGAIIKNSAGWSMGNENIRIERKMETPETLAKPSYANHPAVHEVLDNRAYTRSFLVCSKVFAPGRSQFHCRADIERRRGSVVAPDRSYCYLPLYIFAGDQLLCARLRPSNVDGAAGALDEVKRIVAQLRARWPKVRIMLRGDSGFCLEELMAWCEADQNQVDFLFGLAHKSQLQKIIGKQMHEPRLMTKCW